MIRFTPTRAALLLGTIAAGLSAGLPSAAQAAGASEKVLQRATGLEIIPASSIANPQDAGIRAHTNVRIFVPGGIHTNVASPYGFYENPMSLGCLYGVTPLVAGCNPSTLTKLPSGGSKMIAIVDAYDYPTATKDLTTYSTYYGLPAITSSNFQVVYATGKKPGIDSTGGWELEEALDIEMAHALAPNAQVVLVEAASNSIAALLAAEKVATAMVVAAGGGEVSNSWGGGESSNEEMQEANFTGKKVVFFASTGDSSGTEFPSVMSNVVGVGGTTVNRDSSGNYSSQSAWSDTGGGVSTYVPIPSYQTSISSIVGTHKGVPDVSLVADPSTGVWVYDSTAYQGTVYNWLVLGGTSVAAPATAALVNNAGHFFASSATELTKIYAAKAKKADFTDVKTGTCGNPSSGSPATKGWDYCTGVGTPLGTAAK